MRCALFFCFIILLFFSCTIRDKQAVAAPVAINPYDTAYNLIREGALLIKEGDLILRNGQEVSSQFIKNFNRADKSYSHAGLVFFRDDYPFVYHIVPGENPGDLKFKTDSLRLFCNPRKNFGFAIYRYEINENEITSLKQSVEQWKADGVVFDSSFNLKTNDRMYCSEMIKKGLAKATNNRIVIATTKPNSTEAKFFSTHLRLPLAYTTNLDVVAIDNLFVNRYCKEIRRFNFTPQK